MAGTTGASEGDAPLLPHREAGRILRAMSSCVPLAAPWSGTVYRLVGQEWAAKKHLLSGVGSQRRGARWNPRGSFPTVYTCLEIETAVAEALYYARRFVPEGIPLARDFWAHYRLSTLEVGFQRVLDVGHEEVLARLRVSRKRMMAEWEPLQDQGREAVTQAIGRAAWTCGLEGMLVPSARRPGSTALVLFPDHWAPKSRIRILRTGKLPARFQRFL